MTNIGKKGELELPIYNGSNKIVQIIKSSPWQLPNQYVFPCLKHVCRFHEVWVAHIFP